MKTVRMLILSDLHLELRSFLPPDPGPYDIVILTVDVCTGTTAVRWAQRQATFNDKPIVLVVVNHEFYGSRRNRILEELRAVAADTNVHLLDPDEVVIQGICVLGAKLWTDFELDVGRGTGVAQAMRDATRALNDCAGQIREHCLGASRMNLFTPQDAAREHALSRAWSQSRQKARVDAASVSATVVVTHHAPHSRSMDPNYEGSELNPAGHLLPNRRVVGAWHARPQAQLVRLCPPPHAHGRRPEGLCSPRGCRREAGIQGGSRRRDRGSANAIERSPG